jgi:hypothetical protein
MKTIKAMLPYIKSISPAESIVASTLLLFCEGLNVTGKIFFNDDRSLSYFCGQ